ELLYGLGGDRIPSQFSTTSTSISTNQYVAYNKNGFKVSLNSSKDSNNPNILNIEVTFHNAAVPKTQKLQMQTSSSTSILPSAIAQQTIHIANSQKSNVRLRLRIVYSTPIGAKISIFLTKILISKYIF
ncbi:11467_t:CDS:2, partial [Gigaspora margarita]